METQHVRNMPVQNLCIVTRKGALGLGQFPEIPLHKQEKEHVLKAVGIKVEHGDQIEYAETRGAYKTPRVGKNAKT